MARKSSHSGGQRLENYCCSCNLSPSCRLYTIYNRLSRTVSVEIVESNLFLFFEAHLLYRYSVLCGIEGLLQLGTEIRTRIQSKTHLCTLYFVILVFLLLLLFCSGHLCAHFCSRGSYFFCHDKAQIENELVCFLI